MKTDLDGWKIDTPAMTDSPGWVCWTATRRDMQVVVTCWSYWWEVTARIGDDSIMLGTHRHGDDAKRWASHICIALEAAQEAAAAWIGTGDHWQGKRWTEGTKGEAGPP